MPATVSPAAISPGRPTASLITECSSPVQGMQYGNVQQPVMPQMEYGQQYQAPTQNAQALQPQAGAQPQQAAQQPAAEKTPAPAASTVERDDLGVPAFLRRPTRK